MKKQVLYIDDERDLTEIAQTFFEEEDVSLDVSCDFKDALDLIKQKQFDLIITDVRMPSGNGHEFIQYIRGEGIYQGKVVVVSGGTFDLDENQHLYDAVFLKPLQFQFLIETVKGLLR